MQQIPNDPRHLEALLDFYAGAGVDCFLQDEPVDWVALTRAQAAQRALAGQHAAAPAHAQQPRQQTPAGNFQGQTGSPVPAVPVAPQAISVPPAVAGQAPVLPDREIIAAARDLAASAPTLEELTQLPGRFRRLQPQTDRQEACVCRRQPTGEADVCRRGAGTRRGSSRPAFCWPFRPIAGQNAGCDRSGSLVGLYRQRGSLAATWQIEHRHRRKPRSASRSFCARSNWSIRTCSSFSAQHPPRPCSGYRTASARCAGAG